MIQLDNFLLQPHETIRAAMLLIDRNTQGIALIVDPEHRLLGTVTDGDIRRALLGGLELHSPLRTLLERKAASPYPHPIAAPIETDPSTLRQMMTERSVRQIPLLDEAGRVVDLALFSYDPSAPVAHHMIPLAIPEIRGNEWHYIRECLDTGWVSSVGSYVDRFERLVADYVGARYAIATVNGTAALHIALLVAGIEPDDEVLIPALSFIAPANAIRYVGAWPVFMDVEPHYWQLNPQCVQEFLSTTCHTVHGMLRNRRSGRRVRALMPVHILGHPCDMTPLLNIARQYDLIVIEDAAESLGARYRGQMVGNLGDIACVSFNGNKIITTGGGGMLLTNNEAWATRAKYLTTQAKDDSLEYIHHAIGYNYRLTNIQAAMGCAQMEQLDSYIATRRRIATRYATALENTPGIQPMQTASWAYSTSWLSTILVNQQEYGMDSRALLRHLADHQIQTRPLWQPLHRSPAHRQDSVSVCPHAEKVAAQALSLPCSVSLSENDQARVVEVIKKGCAYNGA